MKQRPNDRESAILELLADSGTCSVSELSHRLHVSPATVRSTLSSLEERGYLVRTWGGAVAAFHPRILARQRSMSEQKKRIARAAAALVSDGDTIIIEAGTTTALVAAYLVGSKDISVVTNSTLVIPYARSNPNISLTVVGGLFRPETESFVGPSARELLMQFHVRLAFVGTDGFSFDHGMSTHLLEGAEIVQTVAKQAEQTILLADSSKYGRKGFVRVLPLSAVTRIITDEGLRERMNEQDRERCAESGLSIDTV